MTRADYRLQIIREFDVPAEKLFTVWTTPERFGEWFCPLPWKVTEARADLRPGGESFVLMEGPEGEKVPNPGVYLEIVPGRKIVFTDAYTVGWVPSEKPFMTGIVEFEDLGGGRSRYTASAVHWTEEDMEAHRQMGFEEGWGIVAGQMARVAETI
ncbi:SRPBCC family protein [Neorhizobium sp. NCHU2750]|uniref:SRPBCC family protein n=1 Tax=Neorhizobium sp. NCHU2750 TaxID=1825976 RepID=UPI000E750949|nr:polyketide cyclase [Neorhizobium sp. NCHU2750]